MEWFNGRPSMVHPDYIVAEADFADLPLIEPVYPLTAGLSRRVLGRAIAAALADLPELPEWLDPALVDARDLAGVRRRAQPTPTTRRPRPTSNRRRRTSPASPTTNCWRASSRWP